MIRTLFWMMMILPFKSFTQDPAVLLKEAARLENEFKESEAFVKYAEIVKIQPTNVFALCKCSDLCCRMGGRQTDKTKKIEYFRAGKTYAEAAYHLNPNSCEANIVMAFSIARMAIVEGGKEKVVSASAIKQYAEKAIRCDPSNFRAYHILGRWHYEISGLNSVERTLAKWFCGPLPEASLQESISFFEKSRSLDPAFIPNYLELARAYDREGQKSKAIGLLNYMMTLPDKMYDDGRAKSEGRKLLEEWK